MADTTFTLKDYLASQVNVKVPAKTITGICLKRKVDESAKFVDIEDERDYELPLADIYAFIATSPSLSEKVADGDADWSHSEGGQQMSQSQLAYYRGLANAIYDKYGEPLLSANSTQWGMSGYGFHNIRNYGNTERNR